MALRVVEAGMRRAEAVLDLLDRWRNLRRVKAHAAGEKTNIHQTFSDNTSNLLFYLMKGDKIEGPEAQYGKRVNFHTPKSKFMSVTQIRFSYKPGITLKIALNKHYNALDNSFCNIFTHLLSFVSDPPIYNISSLSKTSRIDTKKKKIKSLILLNNMSQAFYNSSLSQNQQIHQEYGLKKMRNIWRAEPDVTYRPNIT